MSFPAPVYVSSEASLSSVGAACRDSFAVLSESLVAVRGSVVTLLELFGKLSEELAGADLESDPAAEADSAARNLLAALPEDDEAAYVKAQSDTHGALRAIAQQVKSLEALGSLTRITSASLKVDTLGDYVVEIRRIASDIHAQLDALLDCIAVIGEHRGPAREAQRLAGAELRTMRADLAAVQGAMVGLASEEQAFRSDLARRVESLTAGSRAQISFLITSVQFADQFAQRLDHIETILGADIDPAAVEVLAAALERALIDDGEALCRSAIDALGRLSNISRNSDIFALGGSSAGPLGCLLQNRRSALEGVERCNRATARSLSKARAVAQRISAALRDANREFEALRAGAARVATAATNAHLLMAQAGDARLPLAVLSSAVQESAVAFRDCTATASRSIAGLSTGFDDDTLGRLERRMAEFDESVRRSQTGLARANVTEQAISGLMAEAVAALGQLERAVTASRGAMASVMTALDGLRATIPADGGGTVEAHLIAGFADLYTMEREREVHATVAGAAPADAAEAGDEFEFF